MTDAPTILSPSKKYCEDCKFCFVPTTGMRHARCTNPAATVKLGDPGDDMVSRQFDVLDHDYAALVRKNTNKCGPEASWFEPKTVEVAA